MNIHVAKTGSDQAVGSSVAPLASLSVAVKRLLGRGGVIWMHEGSYELEESVVLEGKHFPASLVIQAVDGDTVRLSGGRVLAPAAFQPLRDPNLLARLAEGVGDRVLTLDLVAHGVPDAGQNLPRGFGFPSTVAESELFFDDCPLPISRWPREGYAKTGVIVAPGQKHGAKSYGVDRAHDGVPQEQDVGALFTGDAARLRRWSSPANLRCFGMWHRDWAPATQPVVRLDKEKGLIQLRDSTTYGVSAGRNYCVLNAIEEIAQPGDWALDHDSGTLFVYPPQGWDEGRIMVSRLGGPLLDLRGTVGMRIQGLILEGTRGDALRVDGEDNRVVGCTIRNLGGKGIQVRGMRNQIQSCDIHDAGQGGVSLVGGDRRTLTPASHRVENCDIHDFNRICTTYMPAVGLSGVGHIVRHNHLHAGPHNAILLAGNDHLMEFNEIDHVACGTDDAAAIYMGRNPSQQGNVIRHNYFHHIGSPSGWGTAAIYADDGECGVHIQGNVFYRCGHAGQVSFGAIFFNAGKDHLLEDNLFVDCRLAVGLMLMTQKGWERLLAREDYSNEEVHTNIYKHVDIDSAVYRRRYPQLAHLKENTGRNILRRNMTVNCGRLVAPEEKQVLEENVVLREDPGFADYSRLDFRLAPRPDFTPPPFAEMGLISDEFRRVLPPRRVLDCRAELRERPRVSYPGEQVAATLRVRLANLGPDTFRGTADCWTNTPEALSFPAGASVGFDLAAYAIGEQDLPVLLTARPDRRVLVGATVRHCSPFTLGESASPRYDCRMPRVAALPPLEALSAMLAETQSFVFMGSGGSAGEVHFALDSRHLGVHAVLHDARIHAGQSWWPEDDSVFWDAPYVGLLAASRSAEGTHHVSQVIFFPRGSAGQGVIWQFFGLQQLTPPTINWQVQALGEQGYTLSALIPREALGLAKTDVFLFEAMASCSVNGKAVPQTLFGSRTAQLELATLAHFRAVHA